MKIPVKCSDCKNPATCYFPCIDIDIPSYPYCDKCGEKRKIKLQMKLLNRIQDTYNSNSK